MKQLFILLAILLSVTSYSQHKNPMLHNVTVARDPNGNDIHPYLEIEEITDKEIEGTIPKYYFTIPVKLTKAQFQLESLKDNIRNLRYNYVDAAIKGGFKWIRVLITQEGFFRVQDCRDYWVYNLLRDSMNVQQVYEPGVYVENEQPVNDAGIVVTDIPKNYQFKWENTPLTQVIKDICDYHRLKPKYQTIILPTNYTGIFDRRGLLKEILILLERDLPYKFKQDGRKLIIQRANLTK